MGEPLTLPVTHATSSPRRGLLGATRFQNGKHLTPGVLLWVHGKRLDLLTPSSFTFAKTETLPFHGG
jgi:hypothetical protein